MYEVITGVIFDIILMTFSVKAVGLKQYNGKPGLEPWRMFFNVYIF